MAENGNAGGANELVAGELENGGNGRFGRLGVSVDWDIRGFGEFGKLVRFVEIRSARKKGGFRKFRKFGNAECSGDSEDSGD